jgi:epoxyqueuosine reductase
LVQPGRANVDWAEVDRLLQPVGLVVLGALAAPLPDPSPDIRSLLLVGPAGRDFWPVFVKSPEYSDGLPDPLDRWSLRIGGDIARPLSAQVLLPSGRQPPWPFISWALASGSFWSSPVGFLVHREYGLMVSFRFALGLDRDLAPDDVRPISPCLSCPGRPCLTACPVTALTRDGYDTGLCHQYLDTLPGSVCMSGGCQVRRSCPTGAEHHDPERAAFHMAAFHR